MQFGGKVAVVTGASKGMGAQIARSLADRGAAVVINYVGGRADAERLAEDITSRGGQAIAVQADITEVPQTLFEAAEAAFGPVDFAINNAGGTIAFSPIADCPEVLYDKVSELNARGTFMVLREAARRTRVGGRIICLSSSAIVLPTAGISPYAGAKSAVALYCAILAEELLPRGITVNAIVPGLTLTEGVAALNLPQVRIDAALKQTSLGRLATVDDIAATVLMLLSDDAAVITGQQIRAGGGAF